MGSTAAEIWQELSEELETLTTGGAQGYVAGTASGAPPATPAGARAASQASTLKAELQRRKRKRWLAVGAAGGSFLAAVCIAVALGTQAAELQGSPKNAEVLSTATAEFTTHKECPLVPGFCESPKSDPGKNKLQFRDCDGDGIVDPYCVGSEMLQFGFLSSRNGCQSNWPSGLCKREQEPDRSKGEFSIATAAPNEITVIHFNDVYQVSGVLHKGVRRGGMSRAAHVINMERMRNPDRTFVFFAGDLLSPSALSDLFDGAHMIDVLNELKIDAASLGNHEFDFGVDTLMKRIEESRFPWLNTNLFSDAGGLIPGTIPRFVKTVPFTPAWSDKPSSAKVCAFGSAYDVRESIFKDRERVQHVDTFQAAGNETQFLRGQAKCDVVMALTHQFSADDCKLAQYLGDKVDLILGGHDHSTELTTVCGHAPYVKADSDLKTQWIMTLWLDDNGKVSSVDGRLLSLTDIDPFDVDIHKRVLEWEEKGRKAMGQVVGCTSEPIVTKEAAVRQIESNAGNFFTDAMRNFHNTDVALMNGGAIRGDKVYPVGNLTKAIVTSMHPFGNTVAKIYITGAQLKAHLETGLSCYEEQCGEFDQISGAGYSFDPTAPKGHRLLKLTHADGTEIGANETLTLAITDYELSRSPLRHNRLFEMTTLNDAVPLLLALYDAIGTKGLQCVAPKLEGRIQVL